MSLNHLVLFFLAAALLGLYILGSEIVERSPRWGRLGRNRFSYALALGSVPGWITTDIRIIFLTLWVMLRGRGQ